MSSLTRSQCIELCISTVTHKSLCQSVLVVCIPFTYAEFIRQRFNSSDRASHLSATTKMATPTIHFSKKSSEGSRNKSMSGHSESYLFCIPVQRLCTYKILDASIQVLSLKSGHHEMVQKLPPSMQIHERRLIQYPIQ